MSLVTCGYAFRLRRLAQSVFPRSAPNLGRGIFPVNFSRSSDDSCDMQTCISIAQARTKCSSAFWAQFGLWHFTCKFPSKVALVKS